MGDWPWEQRVLEGEIREFWLIFTIAAARAVMLGASLLTSLPVLASYCFQEWAWSHSQS